MLEIALVHRPRYDDWSLPKGGIDRGEHALQAAAREVLEETGVTATMGRSLGVTEHDRGDGRAVVHWWAAEAHGDVVEPVGDEVDEVRWVRPEHSHDLLSYQTDQAVLKEFGARPLPDSVFALVRHAKAGDRHAWTGDDNLRPLDRTGEAQARRLAEVLPVFRPAEVLSAAPVRCVQTVTPLADRLDRPVATAAEWGDDALERNPDQVLTALTSVGSRAGSRVLCSQGMTIPALLESLARDETGPGARDIIAASRTRSEELVPRSRKGSTWVLTFRDGEVLSADYFADFAATI